jgi:xanthine/CO dehydrogenase XdhC/CoxF family maturation factor
MMRRYFLNIEFFDHAIAFDADGALFGTVEAACTEAALSLQELITAAMQDHSVRVPKRFSIVDDSGTEVGGVNARQLIPSQLLG